MAKSLNSIIKAANSEWEHWGKSTWDLTKNVKRISHRDDEDDFAKYIITQYCSVGGGSPSISDIQDDRYAWSAVGMSTIMKNAGYSKSEFPFSQSHSTYIRRFIAERHAKNKNASFWGYRHGEPGGAPSVGDLVGYARGKNITPEKAKTFFDKTSGYESHTDVVVAVHANKIEVIGANVLDSVTKKTLAIGDDGHILDNEHKWFVVLKKI